MVRRSEPEPTDHDERLGEAIEAYLALADAGQAPDPEEFAGRHPGLESDLIAALEGLALVRGLVGGSGGSGPGQGPGSRLETGRRIAGYRIVRELGRGGMGVVYEAVHVGLDRPVALKVLGGHAAPDSTGRRRFLNEARTAAGLHHTHIVPVFDVGQVGGLCYYAMQRIEGSGLDRVVRHLRRDRSTAAGSSPGGSSPFRSRLGFRAAPAAPARAVPSNGTGTETGLWPGRGAGDAASASASPGDAAAGLGAAHPADADDGPPPFVPPRGSAYYRWVAAVGREAAEALGHAHQRGVIHRDVKPSNLLVDGRGLVWVADFGLARRLADPGLTQHDSLLGTPRYMSPEQARVGPIDGRSDLFSLGATLYELLTLRPPFDGRSAAELVEQIANREPSPPRQTDPRVPRDLETIVLKLLAKRPADRYATAAEVGDDLTRFLNHEPVRARRISPLGRSWRFARRHPSLTAVSSAAALAVLTVSTVAYVRIMQERDQAVRARSAMQAMMRVGLLREADSVRHSNNPNRRARGLGLIREAAAMKPDPALRAQLRHEAVEFLVLRDVEARPGVPTGPARGVVFNPDGTRLSVLAHPEGGDTLGVWDFSRREKFAEARLRSDAPGSPPEPNGPRPPGNGPRGRGGAGGLTALGPFVALVAPGGQGVRLLDADTGAYARDLKLSGRRVLWLLAAADGRRLVTVEFTPGDANRDRANPPPPPTPGEAPPRPGPPGGHFLVNLWDPGETARPIATLARWDEERNVRSLPLVAVSPDGKTVATARHGKTAVALWGAEAGDSLGPIETQSELNALALGPDGQLATAGNGEVRLWDTDSHTSLPSLAPHQSLVRALRFSPRGSLLAILGISGRGVELWDTAAHTMIALLPTADTVDDVAFAPDGKTLVAVGQGATASVWAVVESGVRSKLSGFDVMTRATAVRPDGLIALGSWKGGVRFWNAGRCVLSPRPDPSAGREEPAPRDRPVSYAFDDRGRLVTLEADGLRVWDDPPQGSDDGARVPLPAPPWFVRPGPPSALAASRDGRTLAFARGTQVYLYRPGGSGRIESVRPPTGPPAPRAPERGGGGRPGGPPGWRAVAVAPGGDRLYLADNHERLNAWALDGTKARPLPWPDPAVDAWCLALRPDGAVLAAGGRAGVVTLIDTRSGAVLARLTPSPAEGEGDGLVSSLAFSPDGKTLAVGTPQGLIEVWSLADTSAPLLRLPGHRGVVSALAFDPRGRHLVSSGSDKTVDVWDLDRIHDEFARLGLAW